MKSQLKVLMLHRIFASYRRPIYDKLDEKYDYILLHSNKDKTIHQSKTPYSKIIKAFQYSKNDTHLFFESFSHLFRFKPAVFIHEFAIGMLSLLPMYVCCRLMGVKFILYSHGYNRLTGFHPNKNLADKYRRFLMNIADATVIYTETDKKRLGAFVNPNKLFVAQNTLDTRHLVAIREDLEREGKDKIKQDLGFTHKYNLIFIGRLLEEKMPDKVLKVFKILNSKLPNQIGIHFVGGGEIADLQHQVEENGWQNAVKFHGAIYDERKSGEFLFASDMMIMPGYLGLAVNHAFIFDCPVVSFQQTKMGPFHSPEIEYVENGKTGFLIPDLSIEKMAEVIYNFLQNIDSQSDIKKNIRHKMEKELTIDNMVKGFVEAIESVANPAFKAQNTEGVIEY